MSCRKHSKPQSATACEINKSADLSAITRTLHRICWNFTNPTSHRTHDGGSITLLFVAPGSWKSLVRAAVFRQSHRAGPHITVQNPELQSAAEEVAELWFVDEPINALSRS